MNRLGCHLSFKNHHETLAANAITLIKVVVVSSAFSAISCLLTAFTTYFKRLADLRS